MQQRVASGWREIFATRSLWTTADDKSSVWMNMHLFRIKVEPHALQPAEVWLALHIGGGKPSAGVTLVYEFCDLNNPGLVVQGENESASPHWPTLQSSSAWSEVGPSVLNPQAAPVLPTPPVQPPQHFCRLRAQSPFGYSTRFQRSVLLLAPKSQWYRLSFTELIIKRQAKNSPDTCLTIPCTHRPLRCQCLSSRTEWATDLEA